MVVLVVQVGSVWLQPPLMKIRRLGYSLTMYAAACEVEHGLESLGAVGDGDVVVRKVACGDAFSVDGVPEAFCCQRSSSWAQCWSVRYRISFVNAVA